MGKSQGAVKALQHSAIVALRKTLLVAENEESREFDNILDECLERLLVKGETIEQCLQSYPEHAARA